ncbi:TPA: hypothetical protein N0F65_005238, partial [Lagenidium giganteum]
ASDEAEDDDDIASDAGADAIGLANLVERIKTEVKSEDRNERVKSFLEEFVNTNAGNDVTLCYSVLLVDTTYKTNDLGYKLFGMMIEEAYGIGQFVQHSFVDHETRKNLELCVDAFKKNNPSWENVRAIVADKDMNEIGVLARAFPNARCLLCPFHVLQHFKKTALRVVDSKCLTNVFCFLGKFGIPSSMENAVQVAIKKMVYAPSERRYVDVRDQLLSDIRQAKDRCGDARTFKEYFLKTWDACRDSWVSCYRADVVYLGNNTNNRIESARSSTGIRSWVALELVIASQLAAFTAKDADLRTPSNINYDENMPLSSKSRLGMRRN